ncbi:short-chain dehydrogenase [Pollutimonas nitritireducens]|uniref:Short-chain dehydrogenase n=1 Tax=Pollutimonas nitritireducens TaxID=2045209 RepID=A0A2N4UAV4_9BURK|nr:short-chain dehydrogenase/reductase [Pollutimonas nitritireducens]PLC52146.1 short-chain dehydrogenase [Pollutimonas nitritireducens]
MNSNLRGKVALITGGSKGIGFAIAQALASHGCALRLVGRDMASLEEAQRAITKEHAVEVLLRSEDLSLPERATALGEAFPETDILVNCAGAIARGSLMEIDPDMFRTSFNGKVMSTIMLSRALYPHMCQRKAGVILNIIGIAGEKLNPKSIGTTTANAALIAFTKALGAESVDYGVRVVGINPGLIRTGRTAGLLNPISEQDRAAYSTLLKNLPYGRMGEPHEVADVAVFLISDAAKYISGEVVSVDAGSRYRT